MGGAALLLLALVLFWVAADPGYAQAPAMPSSNEPDSDTILGFIVIAAGVYGWWWWKRRRRDDARSAAALQAAAVAPPPISREAPGPERARDNGAARWHGSGETAGSVFISYRRGDAGDVVGRIYDRLVDRFGKPNVFKDVDSIPLGVDFRTHLSESVGKCRVFLAVISRGWLQQADGERRISQANDFVRIEIEAALQRNIPVIPVLVQDAALPKEEDLPASLRELAYRNATVVRADPDFHADIARLMDGIAFHLEKESARTASARPH
jgi:hypothetical protein